MKEELQYALIISDSHSNIVDELVKKAKSCTKKENSSFRNKSFYKKDVGKYFSNTVDLVFRQRKKSHLITPKVMEEKKFDNFDDVVQKINAIPLLNYQN